MSTYVFATGNPEKVKLFAKYAQVEIENQSVGAHEIQSLDLTEVTTEKAKAAFAEIGRPVMVDDAGFIICSLGRLPGTFVRWFIEEIGLEKICRLADISEDRTSVAQAEYVLYDGQDFKRFNGSLHGNIAQHASGNRGFGWHGIFIPDGATKTLADMNETEFSKYYLQIKPLDKIGEYLRMKEQS